MNPKVEENKTEKPDAGFIGKFKMLENKKIQAVLLVIVSILLLGPIIFLIFSNLSSTNISQIQQGRPYLIYPGAPYAQDQLIVKFKEEYTYEELTRLQAKLDELGVISQEQIFETLDPSLKDFYLLRLKKGTDIKGALEKLVGFQEIEQAGPNYIVKTQEAPNDQLYPSQWDLQKIGMAEAWDLTHGSNNVKVAVVDSGVNYKHPDLAGRITNGRDFSTCSTVLNHSECVTKERDNDSNDDLGHGTHVAGTIGALTNNRIGVAGINWNVNILAVKTVGSSGEGVVTDVVDGVRFAADSGAAIINMSLGAPFPCSDESVLGYQEAVNYAESKGVLVIVAAGNENIDASLETPASCDGVLTVGATTISDDRAPYSNYGPIVDIAAPGGQKPCSPASCITSSWLTTQYASVDGTSMAAPHVTGVAALLLSAAPNLSAEQLRSCLIDNGDIINTDKPIGGKRLNAAKTIQVCSGLSAAPTQAPTLTPTPIKSGPSPTPPAGGSITPTSSDIFPVSTFAPTAFVTKKPSPTPVQTYTCREKSKSGQAPPGTIQIGNLECVPN